MKLRTALLAALVGVSSLFVAAHPAAATTAAALDPSVDNGTGYDGRGDIVSFGGDYRDNLVTLAVKTRLPVNPATDSNWISYLTGALISMDVNGDEADDYHVTIINIGGVIATVYRDSDDTELCDADFSYDSSSGNIFAHFPATCIGTPPGFAIQAFVLYKTASTSSSDITSYDAYVTRTVTTTTPPPPPPPPPAPVDPPVTAAGDHSGYWMLTRSGSVYGFGSARNLTLPAGTYVDIEPTPTGNGYWAMTEGGGITAKGDASTDRIYSIGVQPGERAVSLSSTPSGKGLWIFTDRGRVIPQGDAQHFGDMSGVALNGPVLGSVATPTGQGYWMVGSDGGIFSFGDASFHGSTGGMKLNKPVMAMAPAADGSGYWLVASDGGIFAFDVPFYGSMGGTPLNKPISGMVPGSGGYMMVGQDGGIFSFGSVAFHGSLGASPPASPVVSVALQP